MPNVAQGSSTAYTYAQLEGLWIQAGGPRALAPVAAAIALAESRGDPGAVNPNDNNGTQSSYGLWQVSNGTHAPPVPNWQNPHVNAQLAVAKWKAAGDSFSPWGTFNSGAYKAFLSNRTTPQAVPGGAAAGGGGACGADCLWCLSLGGSSGAPPPGLNAVQRLKYVASHSQAGVGLAPGLPSLPGSFCLIYKSQARAFIGGTLMAVGGVVGLVGLAILAGSAFSKSSGALGKAADATAVVPLPGAQAASAGLRKASQAPAKRQAKSKARASKKPAKAKPNTAPKSKTKGP